MWELNRHYTRIKLCEFEWLDPAYEAALLGVDALGFHLFHQHPVVEKLHRFREIVRFLPNGVEAMLLTDLEPAALALVLDAVPFGSVQLYPDWPPETIAALKTSGRPIRILKVVSARPEENDPPDLAAFLGRYDGVVDGFLLDSTRAGGTGEPADWRLCAQFVGMTRHPVFLAGGLTPENVGEAVRKVRPYGVDVETGVSFRPEGGPLVKSIEKCRRFIDAVTRADRDQLRTRG